MRPNPYHQLLQIGSRIALGIQVAGVGSPYSFKHLHIVLNHQLMLCTLAVPGIKRMISDHGKSAIVQCTLFLNQTMTDGWIYPPMVIDSEHGMEIQIPWGKHNVVIWPIPSLSMFIEILHKMIILKCIAFNLQAKLPFTLILQVNPRCLILGFQGKLPHKINTDWVISTIAEKISLLYRTINTDKVHGSSASPVIFCPFLFLSVQALACHVVSCGFFNTF